MSKDIVLLDIEEHNSLLFKVNIEGTDPAPAKVRLVCESSDGVSYMFRGRALGQDDLVEFIVPSMADRMKEGLCSAHLEVLIENRFFTPIEFDIDFKKTMKVVAENMSVVKTSMPTVSVTASPVIKPLPSRSPSKFPVPEHAPQRVPLTQKKVPTEFSPVHKTVPGTRQPIVPVRKDMSPVSVSEPLNEDDVRTLARELVDEIMSKRTKK